MRDWICASDAIRQLLAPSCRQYSILVLSKVATPLSSQQSAVKAAASPLQSRLVQLPNFCLCRFGRGKYRNYFQSLASNSKGMESHNLLSAQPLGLSGDAYLQGSKARQASTEYNMINLKPLNLLLQDLSWGSFASSLLCSPKTPNRTPLAESNQTPPKQGPVPSVCYAGISRFAGLDDCMPMSCSPQTPRDSTQVTKYPTWLSWNGCCVLGICKSRVPEATRYFMAFNGPV